MKKSRILISLLVMALSAALIGGATMAWFTDSAESAPVTMTAGTLLIDIDNAGVAESNTVVLENLNPGDEVDYTFDVLNVGTKRLIFTGLLCYNEETGDWDNEMLYDKGYGSKQLSEVLLMDVTVVGQASPFYSGTLAGFVNGTDSLGGYPSGLLPDDLTNPPIVFGEAGLDPGDELSYEVKFTLPTETNNDYQGSSIKLALSVMAKQIHEDAEYGEFVCPLCPPFPSSNLQNKLSQAPLRLGQAAPHVNFVSADAVEETITLEFINPANTNMALYFERRIDGNVLTSGTPHYNPFPYICEGEVVYPSTKVDNGTTTTLTFDAKERIEIRLAYGGERDWDFDWTTFYVK